MTPISICVIMKNEEKHMDNFLSGITKAFGNYPYEIVLVDTGSTDKTISIAKKYTDTIYHFDWIQDFSAARNFSLNCASHDWILVLDCDEYITELDTNGFQLMINHHPASVGMINRKNHYEMNGTDSISTDLVERFFNKKRFHYEGIIHEQVRAFDGTDYRRVAFPLTIDHLGYNGSIEELKQKSQRNITLLEKMLEKDSDNPYIYFQLGQAYNMMKDDEKACYYYGKGLEYEVEPQLEYVQMMVVGYGYALLNLGRFDEALLFQNIYAEFASSADFVCLMGLIYLRNGMLVESVEEFLKATEFETARTEGANSFIPTFNLGCINEVLGETDTAIALYRKCGKFKPAMDRLKEMGA